MSEARVVYVVNGTALSAAEYAIWSKLERIERMLVASGFRDPLEPIQMS